MRDESYWAERPAATPDMIPDVPEHYNRLFLCDPEWDGPWTVSTYRGRWRLRYTLPNGMGERTELFADQLSAFSRAKGIRDAINIGRYVDPAYRQVGPVELLATLILSAPSPKSTRPLHASTRQRRLDRCVRHIFSRIDGESVDGFVRQVGDLDAYLDALPYEATTRVLFRADLRWLVGRLVDLGLARPRVLNGLPGVSVRRGKGEVPSDDDYTALIDALPPAAQVLVQVIEETICRVGEADALTARDWRPDLGSLAVRAQGPERDKKKAGAGLLHRVSPELAATLDDLVQRYPVGPLLRLSDGTAVTEGRLTALLRETADDLALEPITGAALRFIGASRLLAAGWPPDEVKKKLTHARLSTSETFYFRRIAGRERVAVDAIDAALMAARPVQPAPHRDEV